MSNPKRKLRLKHGAVVVADFYGHQSCPIVVLSDGVPGHVGQRKSGLFTHSLDRGKLKAFFVRCNLVTISYIKIVARQLTLLPCFLERQLDLSDLDSSARKAT